MVMKKILVPLDGTAQAEKALPYAIQLAHQSGATLILKQVVEVNPLLRGEILAEAELELIEKSQAYLKLIHAEISDPARKINLPFGQIETIISFGKPVSVIAELAEVEEADLIVMTTKGRSKLGEVMLGSVALGVVHASPVPVILIRPDSHVKITLAQLLDDSDSLSLATTVEKPPILLALDSLHYSKKLVELIETVAQLYAATVYLLEVVVPPPPAIPAVYSYGLGGTAYGNFIDKPEPVSLVSQQETARNYLGHLQARFNQQGIPCIKAVRTGEAVAEITDYADQIDAKFIAMATRVASRLDLLLGSTAYEVLRFSKRPLLLAHPD